VLKGYGDEQQISRSQLAYGEAKANFDGVTGTAGGAAGWVGWHKRL
jgi:hypothetical protein